VNGKVKYSRVSNCLLSLAKNESVTSKIRIDNGVGNENTRRNMTRTEHFGQVLIEASKFLPGRSG